jgi:hypothetical protein
MLSEDGQLSLKEYALSFGSQVTREPTGDGGDANVVEAAASLQWSGKSDVERSAKGTDPVVAGASRLLAELLLRIPRAMPGARIRPAFSDWTRVAKTLHEAATDLEIWTSLQGGSANYLRQVVDVLAQEHGHPPLRNFGYPAGPLVAILLSAPWYSEERYFEDPMFWTGWIRWFFELPYPLIPLLSASDNRTEFHDRFEPTYSWPLPREVINDANGTKSAGQLLSTFVASPHLFAKAGQALFEVVFFCAAYLAIRVPSRTAATWRVEAASSWLSQSLPRWEFSPRAESLIEEVRSRA